MTNQKKLLMKYLLKEYKEQKRLINQNMQWITLRSINKNIHQRTGSFMDPVNPLSNDIAYGTTQWNILYNKLDAKDKATVIDLNKRNPFHKGQ